MVNIKKQIPKDGKFLEKGINYIFNTNTKDNYLNNAQKQSYVDRVYKRVD